MQLNRKVIKLYLVNLLPSLTGCSRPSGDAMFVLKTLDYKVGQIYVLADTLVQKKHSSIREIKLELHIKIDEA